FLPAQARPAPSPPALPVAAIVWDPAARGGAALNQRSYASAFGSLGVTLEQLAAPDVAPRLARGGLNMLIVPGSATGQLDAARTEAILEFVRRGGNVITEGASPLSE